MDYKRILRIFRKDKTALIGLFMVLFFLLIAVLAPYLSLYEYHEQNILDSFEGPSLRYPLGTDEFGRDIYSRVLWGTRPAFQVGFFSVFLSMIMGVPLGFIAGYHGGKIDIVISWLVDILMSFPALVLGLMVVTLLGAGINNVIIAVAISMLPKFIRLGRGPALSIKEETYIEAAKAMGMSTPRILFFYVLPNAIGPIIIMGTLYIAAAIRIEASLSFLGLGVQPPVPSWGNMVRSGVNNILQTPWLAIVPGVAIAIAVLSFNMIGDALRDIIDPETNI